MNETQKVFLRNGLGIIHIDVRINDIYDREDIYSNRAQFKELMKSKVKLFNEGVDLESVTIQQFDYLKNDTLVVVGKILEYVVVNYEGDNSEQIAAKKSASNTKNNIWFVLIDLNYSKKIKSIELVFQKSIIDPIKFMTTMICTDKVVEVIETPPIETSFTQGESLVNIKFKNFPEETNNIVVTLYDKYKDLMGKFKPNNGMMFVAITDLAFDTYYYKVSAFEDDTKISESKEMKFVLNRPNYSGKPIR